MRTRSTLMKLVAAGSAVNVDVGWYPVRDTALNNLTNVANGTGVFGFDYDADAPDGTRNWCNMPHVGPARYARAPPEYQLVYVEVTHRHHKRTPYAANAFPVEPYPWDCEDAQLFQYARPSHPARGRGREKGRPAPARTYRQGYLWPAGPLPLAPAPAGSGWTGTCQFPQITAAGLDDAWRHGRDLYAVYHDLLGFLPGRHADGDGDGNGNWRSRAVYRVTQNVITSQTAAMVVGGMWATIEAVPLAMAAAGQDSLEPTYPCAVASRLSDAITSVHDPAWAAHLAAAASLYAVLDGISGVGPSDPSFHASLDHYYDNLSARQCHGKPLPCRGGGARAGAGADHAACVGQDAADAVYRFGHWEYAHVYRGSPASLAASVASYGVRVAELAAHLRAAAVRSGSGSGSGSDPLWYHNVAHDGSVSRLLSVLQVDEMTWPGMGAEVVFELYRYRTVGDGRHFVRVLYGGEVLTSSSPTLAVMDMVPLETLLAYFDGLVGVNASLVPGKCQDVGDL